MNDIEMSSFELPRDEDTQVAPRNRLPTFWEVLARRTLPPIDLFSFYIYMRDQQRSVDYLDFWLEVTQHSLLCRHYVREIHSSTRAERPNTPSGSIVGLAATPTENSPGAERITRSDLRASSERILYTYLLPGSEREIAIPERILNKLIVDIEEEGRHDPEVFEAARNYVYHLMEQDAFPGFLQAKALGNLTPVSIAFRVVAGFASLFGGLWTAFTLVFLNYDRVIRCWIVLPLLIATYFLISYEYKLDPILGIYGFSEYTFMSYARIRDPYIRGLLMKRSFSAVVLTLLCTSAGCALFIFVPGPSHKR